MSKLRLNSDLRPKKVEQCCRSGLNRQAIGQVNEPLDSVKNLELVVRRSSRAISSDGTCTKTDGDVGKLSTAGKSEPTYAITSVG
jgi:hypothetical protein